MFNCYSNFVKTVWAEVQEELQEEDPNTSFADVSREIAAMWREMSSSEKKAYKVH